MSESEKNSNEEKTEQIYSGFDLYPERRSGPRSYGFWDRFWTKDAAYAKANIKCETSVCRAFERNPMIKILTGALKKAGCPFQMNRHIVCEECSSNVTGGYDSEFNQIVICQNSRKARKYADSIIVHELIHMYDRCVNETDFSNIDHLACSEIRAANLAHCSFLSSFLLLESSPFKIKKTHQYCVKSKAAHSVMVARNVDFETAMDAVLRVFDKCYNDLEPIGRRIKRRSVDAFMAYDESKHFGFCD